MPRVADGGDQSAIAFPTAAEFEMHTSTAEMANLIKSVVQTGQSCIVIEHKMEMISALCDRVVVLNFGKVICDGVRSDVFTDPDVIAAYLGPEEVI